MSRTKPEVHTTSPVEHVLEWVGHDQGGFFKVYDKDTKTTAEVKLPLRFAYLDCKKAVAGYYEAVKRGFYSNEIRNTKKQAFEVKYYKDGAVHPVANGLWDDIKGDIGSKGAKFCNMVYATLLTATDAIGSGTLVKIPFVGSAGSAWIDLAIKDGESFEITGFVDKVKGRTKYREPVIVKVEISEEEGALANEHDAALQAYFAAGKPAATQDESAPDRDEVPHSVIDEQEHMVPEDDSDLVPF